MEIVYHGPLGDGVTIAETGQHAEWGVIVDVPADVATELLEQNVWALAGDGLDALDRSQLVALARDAGVAITGRKPELVDRLRTTAAAVVHALGAHTTQAPVTGEEEHPNVAA